MFEYAAHYGQLVEIVDIDCSLDEIPANENGNLVELETQTPPRPVNMKCD